MCSKKKRKRKSSIIYINVVFDDDSSKVININAKGRDVTPKLETEIKTNEKRIEIEETTDNNKKTNESKLKQHSTYEKITKANQELSHNIESLKKRFQDLKNDINTKNEQIKLKTESITNKSRSNLVLKYNTVKTKESVTFKIWHENKNFDANDSEFTPVEVTSANRKKLKSKLSKLLYFRRDKRKNETNKGPNARKGNTNTTGANWIEKLQTKLEKSKVRTYRRRNQKLTINSTPETQKKSQVHFFNPIHTWILRNTKQDRRAFIKDAKEFSRKIEGIIRSKPKPRLNLNIHEDADIDISNEIVYDIINYDSLTTNEEETIKDAESNLETEGETTHKLNLNSIMRSPLERNIDTSRDGRAKKFNIIYVNIITDGDFNNDQNRVYGLQDSSDNGSQSTVSRSKLTQSILDNYNKYLMPCTDSSWCASESNLYSLGTNDQSSEVNEIYNVSQSCPNVYEDIYSENESSESLEESDYGKLFQKLKEWTLSKVLEKEDELRLQPKDSLIVLRKRQLYALKNQFTPDFEIGNDKKAFRKEDTVKFVELSKDINSGLNCNISNDHNLSQRISSVYSCNKTSCKKKSNKICLSTIKIKDINTQCDSSNCTLRTAKPCPCANKNVKETLQNKPLVIVSKKCQCAKKSINSKLSRTCCNEDTCQRRKPPKIKMSSSNSSITKKYNPCYCDSKTYICKKRVIKKIGNENEVLVLIRRKCFCDTPIGSLSSDNNDQNCIHPVTKLNYSAEFKEKRYCKKCALNKNRLKLQSRVQGKMNCNDFLTLENNKNNDCNNPVCLEFKNLNNNKINMQVSNVTHSSKKSQNTTSDLVEIDFQVKVKNQDENLKNKTQNKKNIYLYKVDNKNKNTNDVKIKLIIKGNKNNVTVEKEPKNIQIDEFSRKISDKFRTISTTASNNNLDTDFSINRATISQTSFQTDNTKTCGANNKNRLNNKNLSEDSKITKSHGKNDQSIHCKATNNDELLPINIKPKTDGKIDQSGCTKIKNAGMRANENIDVINDEQNGTKEEIELLNIILNKLTDKKVNKRDKRSKKNRLVKEIKKEHLDENFAEILQTEIAKKAVLKIYAESTQSQNHLIAKLPKFYDYHDGYD